MSTVGIHLFSKNPIPGWCKTRLGKEIGQTNAALLQEALLKDHLLFLKTHSILFQGWIGVPTGFQDSQSTVNFLNNSYIIQQTDLGIVMEQALIWGKDHLSWSGSILIGVDSPLAVFNSLKIAVEIVKQNQIVLGPTIDGGVYLIGVPNIWQNPLQATPWGTDQVFHRLFKNAAKSQLSVHLLPIERDIDRKEDLLAIKDELMAESSLFHHVRDFLIKNYF